MKQYYSNRDYIQKCAHHSGIINILIGEPKSKILKPFFRPREAAASTFVESLSPSLSLSLSLSKNYSSYLLQINICSVCVCVCVCVVTLSVVVVLNLGVQKISAITKVHSDNVRNIFLKLAEFNKFYLKF